MSDPTALDTITAIASPPGRAPRGIVRVSGPRTLEILKARFQPALHQEQGFTATTGTLDLDAGIRAPARLYLFRAPRSYTAEDLCEIHTVGSPPLLDAILEVLLGAGARLAEPGEFTRRAFLNGRLQLNQVEAVARVIHAADRAELKHAVEQLSGHVAGEVAHLREALMHITSRLELDIDFSDQDVQIVSTEEIRERIEITGQKIRTALAAQAALPIPEDGVTVVLTGPPNAGKSTLFNALSESTTTIVSEIAGTTRDVIAATATIEGIRFHLFDTPGLREATDLIERAAQGAATDARRRAAIELLVLDGTATAVPEVFVAPHDAPRLTVVNKCELSCPLPHAASAISASAVTGAGLDRIRHALVEQVRTLPAAEHAFVPNRRHREALAAALSCLERADEAAAANLSPEFIAVDLHGAIDQLKQITGEITTDDVLGKIFADFCIGK